MVGEKFQGREITATLQAPTKDELSMMIDEMQEYASETGLEPIKVLQRGPDPDGGYRAVIVAHNWNPIAWFRKRWEERGGGYEVRTEKKQKKETARVEELELRGKRRAEEATFATDVSGRRSAMLQQRATAETALTKERTSELSAIQAERAARLAREAVEGKLRGERIRQQLAPLRGIVKAVQAGLYKLTAMGREYAEQDNTGVMPLLADGPMRDDEIAGELNLDPLVVRQVLAILKEKGWVATANARDLEDTGFLKIF